MRSKIRLALPVLIEHELCGIALRFVQFVADAACLRARGRQQRCNC